MATDYTQGSWKIEQPLPPDLQWRLRNPKFAVHPAHGSGFVSLATPENVADMKEAACELDRLRRDCAELYQVIGTMAEHCPDPSAPQIVKALDNASDAANGDPRRHDDLLPFIMPERQTCVECDCGKGPCNWIKSRP